MEELQFVEGQDQVVKQVLDVLIPTNVSTLIMSIILGMNFRKWNKPVGNWKILSIFHCIGFFVKCMLSEYNWYSIASNFRDGSSLVIQDVWYIFGGDNGRNFLSDVEVYDPKGNFYHDDNDVRVNRFLWKLDTHL